VPHFLVGSTERILQTAQVVRGTICCCLPSGVDWDAPVSCARLVDHIAFRVQMLALGPTQVMQRVVCCCLVSQSSPASVSAVA
jgi:hypothetical protein